MSFQYHLSLPTSPSNILSVHRVNQAVACNHGPMCSAANSVPKFMSPTLNNPCNASDWSQGQVFTVCETSRRMNRISLSALQLTHSFSDARGSECGCICSRKIALFLGMLPWALAEAVGALEAVGAVSDKPDDARIHAFSRLPPRLLRFNFSFLFTPTVMAVS